jgi:hypothetical protein
MQLCGRVHALGTQFGRDFKREKKVLDSGVWYGVYDGLYGGSEAHSSATRGFLEILELDRRKTWSFSPRWEASFSSYSR